jgi:hypothetical protein
MVMHHNNFCLHRFKLGHPHGRAESDDKPKLIFTADEAVNYSLVESEAWREQV